MIKNIPNKYDKNMLMKEINLKFKGKYDFFYLPIDFTVILRKYFLWNTKYSLETQRYEYKGRKNMLIRTIPF